MPLDVLGSLSAPKTNGGTDPEAMRDEIEGLASGMLALVGVQSDPLSGREHILLSNIIEQAWVTGDDRVAGHGPVKRNDGHRLGPASDRPKRARTLREVC